MPSRKYELVCDEDSTMRQKSARDRDKIRKVSIVSSVDYSPKVLHRDGYVCEVSKSPRAPQYEIHYQKSNSDGIRAVHIRRNKPVPKSPGSGGRYRQGDDRSVAIRAQSKPSVPEREIKRRREMKGLQVIACNNSDGLYYPGFVERTLETTYAVVHFNFKKQRKIRTHLIIPISGAIARPELSTGDFVLVRVFNQSHKLDCYVPGIVEFIPEDQRHHAKFYSILMYNGQRATTMRKYLVKIGNQRFAVAVNYIASLQQHLDKSKGALFDVSNVRARRSNEPESATETDRTDKSTDQSTHRSTARSSNKSQGSSIVLLRRSNEPESATETDRSNDHSTHRSTARSSHKSRSSRSSATRSRSKSSRSPSSSRSSSSSRSRSRRTVEKKVKSRVKSRSSSRSISRSRSISESSTPRANESETDLTPRKAAKSPFERPSSPVPGPRPRSPLIRRIDSRMEPITRPDIYTVKNHGHGHHYLADDEDKDRLISQLQHDLAKQKRKQFRQEQRLVRQARKINKIQHKLQNDSAQSDKMRSLISSGDDTDTQNRKVSPDGISYRESPDLLSIRRSLPGLRAGKEVLARWADDGWYYRGTVLQESDEHRYAVGDITGHVEVIWREDILTEDKYDAVQPQDYVIALHPKYVFSYAPGEVLHTYANHNVEVEFFDGAVAKLPAREVFKTSKLKFQKDTDYIIEREKRLHGKSVVARDDDTGVYRLGVVASRVGTGQQYFIKWQDGEVVKQNANHLFEVTQRRSRDDGCEYMLAPVGLRNTQFLPGQVVQTDPLHVQLCNGKRITSVSVDQCFWLSKDYYQNAVEYIYSRNQGTVSDSD